MNALKHMEFIFGGVVVAGCVAAALPDAAVTAPTTTAAAAAAGQMPVVAIKAKRMTALEKRRAPELDTGGHASSAGS